MMSFRVAAFVLIVLAMPLRPSIAGERVNFNRDIRPILSDNCFACHGLDKNARKADLRLDLREDAVGKKAIVPGRPDDSSLMERILSHDGDVVMPKPKSNKVLTDEQKDLLRQWIEEGAEYHPHWAFIPVPKEVAIPQPADPHHWIRSPIDAFVLARLNREGLHPAAETSREKWLRRASFDLTGLPPTLAELDLFLADTSPLACEDAADRLLNSPAFGERMANEWLDLARYADTFGYQSDRDMHVWPWRDWVIKAFNENLSYDQFIIRQTAGDLLPNATRDQQLATAFNRLHRQTNEGGSIEAEFRQAYIADRVVTNGTAFLGLTLECARCHDHKYDPITQAEFYKLSAFFTNIDESGIYSHFTETAPTPAMLLYDGEQETRHAELLQKIRAKQDELVVIDHEAQARYLEHFLAKIEIADFMALSMALEVLPSPLIAPKRHESFDGVELAGENRRVPGVAGQAVEFGGDDAFSCQGAGQYGRTTPFSISLWLKPKEEKPRVIVFHQCVAAEDAAFRGYSLVLDQGRLEFSLIHFWPGNAVQVVSQSAIPLNEWTHVTVVYDGSSQADGIRLFVNGRADNVRIIRDNLTRDIKYRKEWGDSNSNGVELSLGARFRDTGFHGGAIDELSVFDCELSSLEVEKLYFDQLSPASVTSKLPLNDSIAGRFELYKLRVDEPYRKALHELQALRDEENELVTQVRQIMVMRESREKRPTYVLKRGAYDSPGEQVAADTPASILPFSEKYPKNRLGLAEWFVDDQNPLTSRVAVNRFWSFFFGRGLVASVEDFGGQGQLPSHPELLDWLARDFVNSGWNVKRFCKQIVLSATYRQSSVPHDPRSNHDDPNNVLLAKGPRYRLSAEQLRDNALAVSGLLVSTRGGPSVMPYQPAGLWEEAGTGKKYHQSIGEGLYRRSLYTFWRRTSPPPNMLTFDATSHETCTARRERTATPLQALVLLNDPQYVEAARVLAVRLLQPTEGGIESRLCKGFRLLTSRNPSARELDVLLRLYEDQKQHFDGALDDAKAFLSIGDTVHDDSIDPAELAAMTVVAKTLFSFDECVTKR